MKMMITKTLLVTVASTMMWSVGLHNLTVTLGVMRTSFGPKSGEVPEGW
jgi:cellobiose-specific phosphotransferase system component IIC